jgi:predicted nucleic acid-binding protein
MNSLILDTDVLIDYHREHPDAVAYIDSLTEAPAIPAVVVAERYAGVSNGHERAKLDELAATSHIIPLTREMAVRGGTLVTLNRKHFPMLPNPLVPYQKA